MSSTNVNNQEYMHIFEQLLQQALEVQTQALNKHPKMPIISQFTKSFRELCTSLINQNKYMIENGAEGNSMNMSFLRHSYRPSNASDFGELRKTEQKLEEYRVVLKNLEQENKHSKVREKQMQDELDQLRNENQSLNEQIQEILQRHQSTKRNLSATMKQQQTLEIQELLKLHEESEDILKKKLKDQSIDMQSLESQNIDFKQELRVKDDQLYILQNELQKQMTLYNELQHEKFDITLSIQRDKNNKVKAQSRDGLSQTHRASSQLTSVISESIEVKRNQIAQSLILEEIIKNSHKNDSQERLYAERLEDQKLMYDKLEEKFRTIIREREIIEQAISGIVDFEQICESKLETLMKTVTDYQNSQVNRDSQQQVQIHSLHQFLQSTLKEAMLIFENEEQVKNKFIDLCNNLGYQSMGQTFDSLISILFSQDQQKQNSEIFVEFQNQISDLKVTINKQNREIDELNVKIINQENDKSLEQLKDRLVNEKQQLQHQSQNLENTLSQANSRVRILEDDQKTVYQSLISLINQQHMSAHAFIDRSKEPLFGLIKNQMLEMLEQLRLHCDNLRQDNDNFKNQTQKMHEQLKVLQDSSKDNKTIGDLKTEIEGLKYQLKSSLVNNQFNQSDDRKQQMYLEQILRNLQDLKYQNESTMHVSPHRSHMINHFSENQSINNSSYPTRRENSNNHSTLNNNHLNLQDEQDLSERDESYMQTTGGQKSQVIVNHLHLEKDAQTQIINPKRQSLTPRQSKPQNDYNQYLHNKSVEEDKSSINDSRVSKNTHGTRKSNALQEMSFNNILNTQKKTPHNKENLDSLIQKFRLENQAFSSRVQNLKSRIDNAYDKFANQQKPKQPMEYKQKKERPSINRNENNHQQRFSVNSAESEEDVHHRSQNSSQYPQVQIEVDETPHGEYGRKGGKDRDSTGTMQNNNSNQATRNPNNVFGGAQSSRRTSENNYSGIYKKMAKANISNNSMNKRKYIQTSDDEMSDELESEHIFDKESTKIVTRQKAETMVQKHQRTQNKLINKFQMFTAQKDHNRSSQN
ncbi:UNKNOWN [Stylonychia lemnae]|uniref:Uncharacterized protein n=1 Tax=Stylonychia lemnae TaxID=5949 RepID=A0A078ADQ8_STYLE|nr:UNKNOWN [Stylonychia lemnae]|eukprot:CDW80365.1 UNKNOWN [Stylonychia lemnae]